MERMHTVGEDVSEDKDKINVWVSDAQAPEMLEHDIIVQVPPKRRYTLEIEVKNIRKGMPVIVEPEKK